MYEKKWTDHTGGRPTDFQLSGFLVSRFPGVQKRAENPTRAPAGFAMGANF